jgi:head-tail adaptor
VRGPYFLSRKLVLEAVTRQPDNAGGYTETWVVLGEIWADIRAGIGRERNLSVATISAVPYRVITRSAPIGAASRPQPGQRFRDGDRMFRIEAVSDGDRHGLYLECFTKEEVLT